MLYIIAMVLLFLWLLGFMSSYTLGGYIHVALIVALVLFIVGFFQSRGRKS
jgi:hypothetical protein